MDCEAYKYKVAPSFCPRIYNLKVYVVEQGSLGIDFFDP